MDLSYKIIGGDGREYGPVPLAELKAWIMDGRVDGPTQVCRSDSTMWTVAASYAELQPEIGQVAAITTEAASGPLELTGFWARFAAHLLDGIVMTAVFYLIWGPGIFQLTLPAAGAPPDVAALLILLLKQTALQQLIQMIYYVGLTGAFGATLGKLAVQARVVRMDGTRIGYGRAAVRWLASIVSGLTLGLGYLFVAFREDKRALHDLLAGTQVVYRR